jgi:hypothetical protein
MLVIKRRTFPFAFILIVIAGLCGLGYFAISRPAESIKAGLGNELEFVKAWPENAPFFSGKFFQGKLYKAGKIDVVVLEGTYEEMGRQYGALLKEKLTENYEGIIGGMKSMDGLSAEELEKEGASMYDGYPEKYKKIVDGLSETSGLGIKNAKILLAQEMYVFSGLLEIAKGINISGAGACSGIAAWGEYTGNGPLVFGRNYDLGPVNHEYAMLTVYNPVDGSIPTANFTFAGAIYVTSGINREGLFLELNNGSASDPGNFSGKRPFAPITLFSFLEQAKNNSELSVFFNAALPDLAYIVNAADATDGYSFEWSTNGVKRRSPDKPGLLAATNLFFDPAWSAPGYDVKKDPDFVVKRRDNLLELGEKYKGKFNPETMMKVIATPLEEGGAFRPPNLTSFQIVTEPASRKLWLRVPQYQDWVEVDLAQFFNRK